MEIGVTSPWSAGNKVGRVAHCVSMSGPPDFDWLASVKLEMMVVFDWGTTVIATPGLAFSYSAMRCVIHLVMPGMSLSPQNQKLMLVLLDALACVAAGTTASARPIAPTHSPEIAFMANRLRGRERRVDEYVLFIEPSLRDNHCVERLTST